MNLLGTRTNFVLAPSKRKCILCGKGYHYCNCRCHCGKKKWKFDKYLGVWFHHVCGGVVDAKRIRTIRLPAPGVGYLE